MKNILQKLYANKELSREEAYEMLNNITNGSVNDAQITSFISAYLMRQPTIHEMQGFRDSIIQQCRSIYLPSTSAIDIVGTGGDGKDTFNISTLSSFIVAGAGYKVIKHGNYGSTTSNGSSNVLEYLGFKFINHEALLNDQLEKSNICFLHAPVFHPAMKRVSKIRKDLGLRTFFNLLGPLVNPVQPGYLLLGTSTMYHARLYHYMLQQSDVNYKIVYSLDGYDEISLTGPFKTYARKTEHLFYPKNLGLNKISPEDLWSGNSIKDAAGIFLKVLHGKATEAQTDVVLANSAMAIHCLNEERISLDECMLQAKESLKSLKALNSFKSSLKIIHKTL